MLRTCTLAAAALGLLACAPRAVLGAYVARTASESSGAFGWFRADVPAPEGALYADPFHLIGPSLEGASCADLAGRPVYVLVPGVGGDGIEMQRTVALLTASGASVLMMRWAPWDEREHLVARLAGGLSRAAACEPRTLFLIAHSGGGVLASLAAGSVREPPGAKSPWLTVLTVASPLAGMLVGPRREADERLLFFFDLGTPPRYPKPARGVRVLHLRTHSPADPDMKPFLGHVPNDLRVGVPGARQVDLPPPLTHAGSLVYVARRIADGSLEAWLEGER